MAKRPKSKIQRGFVLGYLAVAVMVVATGFALRSLPQISASTTSTATPTATSSVFTWKGCVDGAANIQFGADPTDVVVKVLDYTYKAIGTHSDCAAKFKDTAPAGTTTGSLTNCATIKLGDSNSSRVTITNDTSIALRKLQGDSALLQPFKVHIADNGTGPFDYQFSLICTKSTVTQTPTSTITATTTTPTATITAKPVAPSCMVGSTAKLVELNDRDKELFGSNAKAYLVKTTDGRSFRIFVGGTMVSSSGTGGQVKLVYGLQNLNTTAIGDGTLGYLKYIYKTDGTPKNATIDFRNKAIQPGAYYKNTRTITVSDFSKAVPNLQMLKSTTAIACITDPINLASLTVGTTPTPTATASAQSEQLTYTFKTGFNTIVAPNNLAVQDSRILDSEAITDMGMYVYDFNRLGQKNWRTTHPNAGANYGLIPQLFDQIGYYIYNPGPELTVSVPVIVKDGPSNNEEKTKLRKGWNLLAVSSDTAQKLSEFQLYVTKKGTAGNCSDDSCIEQVTLKDLLTGDSTTRRAYRTIYEIKDGTATSADAAFTVIKIDTTNIDSITIPAKMPFWIYLWD